MVSSQTKISLILAALQRSFNMISFKKKNKYLKTRFVMQIRAASYPQFSLIGGLKNTNPDNSNNSFNLYLFSFRERECR